MLTNGARFQVVGTKVRLVYISSYYRKIFKQPDYTQYHTTTSINGVPPACKTESVHAGTFTGLVNRGIIKLTSDPQKREFPPPIQESQKRELLPPIQEYLSQKSIESVPIWVLDHEELSKWEFEKSVRAEVALGVFNEE